MKRIVVTLSTGALFGVLGYVYYQFIGCNGGCAIASSPYLSISFGGAIGLLLGSVLSERRAKDADL
jgi:hypothetical protein